MQGGLWSRNVHRSDVPDAVLMLANRVVAVDHVSERTFLLALDSVALLIMKRRPSDG